MPQDGIDHNRLYRLPWTLPDNAISWMEPTSACNLACDGCYRENVRESHKPLDAVREELRLFKQLRRTDGVSIAGGDPLMHPDIIEIVRMIAAEGLKPIINTNGALLTRELLRSLKKSGVVGFTFHVDSKQGRPEWEGKSEIELNDLRLFYAELLAETGGISCAFNSTIYEDTLWSAPDLVEWAARHIDIVQVMVFILYRAAAPNLPFDWYAGGHKIDLDALAYGKTHDRKIDLQSTDVVHEIRKRCPDFTPSAFLNGTEKPDSCKWLLAGRLGTTDRMYGYVGPKFMELMQTSHHFLKGRYLAYATPRMTALGRTMMLLSPFDAGLRGIAGRYMQSFLANPLRLLKGVHYQSVMIIQPVDFLRNGQQNMCDGCPDMTVWKGDLVWSCRLEELKHFGCWVRSVPKQS